MSDIGIYTKDNNGNVIEVLKPKVDERITAIENDIDTIKDDAVSYCDGPSSILTSGYDAGGDLPGITEFGESETDRWNSATQGSTLDIWDDVMYTAQVNSGTHSIRLVAMKWSNDASKRVMLGTTSYSYTGAGHQNNSVYRPSKRDEPLLVLPANVYDDSSTKTTKNYARLVRWDYKNNKNIEEICKLILFDSILYSSGDNIRCTVSADSKLLICLFSRISDGVRYCRVWNMSDVMSAVENRGTNNSVDLTNVNKISFSVADNATDSGQGIYSDGRYIYLMYGGDVCNLSCISIGGNLLYNYPQFSYSSDELNARLVSIGKVSYESDVLYEAEGMFWTRNNGVLTPHMHVSVHYGGTRDRRNRFFNLENKNRYSLEIKRDPIGSGNPIPTFMAANKTPSTTASSYEHVRFYHPRQTNNDSSFKTYTYIGSERTDPSEGNVSTTFKIGYSEHQVNASCFAFSFTGKVTESDGAYSVTETAANFRFNGTSGLASLGISNKKFSELYAVNGTIQTSDERKKTDICNPDDSLMRAWGKVGFKVFKFKDAVEEKRDSARIHVGVIAQEVRDAFASEGLNASDYGLFCYDSWEADEENGIEAGDVYGIRYEEALALECAYQRWRLSRLERLLDDVNLSTKIDNIGDINE